MYAPADEYGYDPALGEVDPFAYTGGTLLMPWQGRFAAPEAAQGGYDVPEFVPFEHGDFGYGYSKPRAFDERYADPGDFSYGEFNPGEEFRAPTERDMKADPGYRFRLDQGMKALTASKAAQKVLKTGGAAKAMTKYGQEVASQEYGNVYGRRASEHDRNFRERGTTYGVNRSNAAENFDRNVGNKRSAYQVRQATWRDNAQVDLEGERLGYDVATGTFDRNLALNRQKWEDAASARAAAASAANAGRDQAYSRSLAEYQMARDEFWTNQDRQYNILDREASRGWDAAYAYGSTGADLAIGRGNAQAAGTVGRANAWTGTLGSIGNAVGEYAVLAGRGGGAARPPATVPNLPYRTGPPAQLPGQVVGPPSIPNNDYWDGR